MRVYETATWHARAHVACATGAQEFSCARRVDGHGFPGGMSGLGGLNGTCTHKEALKLQ